MITIKDGAIFLSDAHANVHRNDFHRFLEQIDAGEIKTPQLFLMGDMFDLLVGQISHTVTFYQPTIDLINKLSRQIEIVYFEGNHDFNLQKIFPGVNVIPISKQPALCQFHEHYLLLSHGDIYQDKNYRRYTRIIRNPFLLTLLNIADKLRSHRISGAILSRQQQKSICREIPDFYRYVKQKIQKYDIGVSKIDFICEGHYHQNKEFVFDTVTYKNFASFACDTHYCQISFTDKIVFKEVLTRG